LTSVLQHNIAVLLDIDIAGRMITACEYSEYISNHELLSGNSPEQACQLTFQAMPCLPLG
jgi:hypothetical protein